VQVVAPSFVNVLNVYAFCNLVSLKEANAKLNDIEAVPFIRSMM